jgi:O-acetyl-ADP-ribose deacetylase (regulator of RNase III)
MDMDINYINGDATRPIGGGNKIIAHICNDIGGWSRGFVLALSKRWSLPERMYRGWHRGDGFSLGDVQFMEVEEDIWVANMICQHGINTVDGIPPIRYGSLLKALTTLKYNAFELRASVHMPRIGCGLAGGEWSKVEPLIKKALCDWGISVFVYDLKVD